MNQIIARIDNTSIFWNGTRMSYMAGFAVDCDGSPRAYHSKSSALGEDSWSSACYPDGNFQDILACDHVGKPVVQTGLSEGEPAKDFFIAMTSYQHAKFGKYDVRRYVDANTVPYGVINGKLRKMVPPKFLGCYGEVRNLKNGIVVPFVTADVGPSNRVGEGSTKLVHLLGYPKASPRNGVDERVFQWSFYPGQPAKINGITYELQ